MFKRILVPLDGSARAERALPIAARIARATDGTVVLLRAVSLPADLTPYLMPEGALAQRATEEGLAEASRYLASVAQSDTLAGIKTETAVVDGLPAPSILAVVGTRNIELIVICSHGYTGFMRWMLGSVAEKVMHHAPVPVLMLSERGPIPAGQHPDAERPLRALIALDGSPLAEEALEPAAHLIAALAAPMRGAVHLVRVLRPPFAEGELGARLPVDKSTREAMLHQAKKYLDDIASRFRTGDLAELKLSVTWSVAFDADVAGTLIRIAENGEDAEGAGVFGRCDLIAMATHGRSGFARSILGSVTERVLHATKLPLFIVRPKAAVAEAETIEKKVVEMNSDIWVGLL
jgi:nucleotide-binding universal stress UspA family protein